MPETMPFVSVILLNYNYAHFLPEAIQSVLAQNYPHFELILMDDGSSDDSRRIMQDWVAHAPERIRMITHPDAAHGGIVASYQRAFGEARGEIVAFLEADDRWRPENLYRKVEILRRHPDVGVVHSAYRAFGDWKGRLYWHLYALLNHGLEMPKRQAYCCFGKLLQRNPVASFSHFVVRKKWLQHVPHLPFFQGNFDWWVLAHISARAAFYFIPEQLVEWRIHAASAGAGRIDAPRLWKLHRFLQKLYDALPLEYLGNAARAQWVEAQCRHAQIQRAKSWFPWEQILLKPFEAFRLWAHLFLKNLAVDG